MTSFIRSISPVTIDGSTVTILGWAHNPAFVDGVATWRIAVFNAQNPKNPYIVGLQAFHTSVIKHFREMYEGEPIRVIAELSKIPTDARKIAECTTALGTRATYEYRLDSPHVNLTVIQLELIGRPVAAVEG